jgi:hypothetical protein
MNNPSILFQWFQQTNALFQVKLEALQLFQLLSYVTKLDTELMEKQQVMMQSPR